MHCAPSQNIPQVVVRITTHGGVCGVHAWSKKEAQVEGWIPWHTPRSMVCSMVTHHSQWCAPRGIMCSLVGTLGQKSPNKKHILKSRFDLMKVNSLHWDDHLLLIEFAYNKVIMLVLRRHLLWLCIGGDVDPRWVGLKLVKWLWLVLIWFWMLWKRWNS